jgi:hypothetical protein
MLIVGFGLCFVLARSRREEGGSGAGDVDRDIMGSGIISLESIHVGGLFSRRDRLIHHDPGRVP